MTPRSISVRAWLGAFVALSYATTASAQTPDPPPAMPGEQQSVAQPADNDAGSDEEQHTRAVRDFQTRADAASAERVARAASKLGRHREAAEHFAIGLSLLPVTATADRERLQALLKAEKAYVATVVVQLEPDANATILVDGIAVGTHPLKLPVYLDPGDHSFAVVAEEKRYVSVRAKVEAGKAVTVRLREGVGVGEPPPKPLWPGIVMGSLGAASLVVGVGTLIVSFARESDADDHAGAIETCNLDALSDDCAELSSLVSDRNALRNASYVGFIMAGVFGAAAIAYVFIPLPSETPDDKPVTALRIGPIAGPGGFGLGVNGTFR